MMPGDFIYPFPLSDQVHYPDVPADSIAARQQFMDLFNAIKDNMNNSLVQLATMAYVADTSAVANTITVVVTKGAYTTGSALMIKVAVTNTGATTINLNALGVKALKKITGAGIVDLSAGDIPAGATIICIYDGVQYVANVGAASQGDLVAHMADLASLTHASHVQLQTSVDTSETKALTPNSLYLFNASYLAILKRKQLGVRI